VHGVAVKEIPDDLTCVVDAFCNGDPEGIVDVEEGAKRRGGIRGSRRRGTALGGDMTHEDQVALEILGRYFRCH
jgi:hypothetical protein